MTIDLISLVTLVVVLFMFSSLTARLKRIESRLGWLEHRLEHGLKALDVEPEQTPTARAVADLVARGDRGEAMRLHMDATGASYDEAREHVNRLASDQP